MKSVLPGVVVALGIVLLLVSAVWAILFPPARTWTDEKGARMAELSGKAHALGFELAAAQKPSMHKGRSLPEVKAEYDQVNAELTSLRDELGGKVAAPARASTILRWSGIAFVVAGGLVVFATRSS
jgi:hypothetical protein